MAWRALFLTAFIAVLLAAYGVLTHRNGDDLKDTAAPEQPGYYLRDATVKETDATGAARLTLRAQTIAQNPADNSITMQQVALDYRIATDAWLLTADSGHVPAASRNINFTGNVVIQPADSQTWPVVMRTDTLNIDTTNNVASTPDKVVIEMNRQRLSGIGLRADLKQQQVRIESQVHGQFSPQ